MRRLILGIGIICLLALVVFAANSNRIKESINKEYSNCMKNCTNDKKDSFIICKNDYKNSSLTCKTTFKTCVNSTNETSTRRNCSKSYTECKRTANNVKVSCLKSQVAEFMICKEECKNQKDNCTKAYEPICGMDNVTYPNLCSLEIANVSKAYDGQCNETNTSCKNKKDCPEIVCIRAPCPTYNCVRGTCVRED